MDLIISDIARSGIHGRELKRFQRFARSHQPYRWCFTSAFCHQQCRPSEPRALPTSQMNCSILSWISLNVLAYEPANRRWSRRRGDGHAAAQRQR
jgi:hypothetical protein